VNQQHRFAGALDLISDLNIVGLKSRHRFAPLRER
jgi:hypothetical protein